MCHESKHVHIYTIYKYTVIYTLTKMTDARETYLQPRQPKDNFKYMYMNMNAHVYVYVYVCTYIHISIGRL